MLVGGLTESHAEDAVSPLEVDAANCQITLEWIEMEEIVLHTIRSIVFKVVNNNSIGAQIWQVSKSSIAVRWNGVDDLKRMKQRKKSIA